MIGAWLYERLRLQVPYSCIATPSVKEISVSTSLLNHGVIHIPGVRSISLYITCTRAKQVNVQDEICVPRQVAKSMRGKQHGFVAS